MQMSNQEFDAFMKTISFRKNQGFKINSENLKRVIDYVEYMEITQTAFEIIEYVIKEFGFSVLLCFQKFYYKMVKLPKLIDKFKQKLQRISALVNCVIKPYKCGQLHFFTIAGTAKKGFNVKQKSFQDNELLNQLQFIRGCIIIQKNNSRLITKSEDISQRLKLINKKIKQKRWSLFSTFYLNRMLLLLQYQYSKKVNTSQEQSKDILDPSEFDQNTQPIEYSNLELISKELQSNENYKNQQIVSRNKINQTNVSGKANDQDSYYEQIYVNNTTFNLSFQYGPNFSLIPLCCRAYFFQGERIMPEQDKMTQYKSQRFPFSHLNKQSFQKSICAFLNEFGGQIYIGIKETINKKYRFVLGNYLTQNDKDDVVKYIRKLTQLIYPNVPHDIKIQFIPIRKSPLPSTISLLNQTQSYLYDFSKKMLNLDNCPYKQARYVIRIRIPYGDKNYQYNYANNELQFNQNQKKCSSIISLQLQNQVQADEITREVLRTSMKKLQYLRQKNYKKHKGMCLEPQMGKRRNQPEPQQQKNNQNEFIRLFEKLQMSMNEKMRNQKQQSSLNILNRIQKSQQSSPKLLSSQNNLQLEQKDQLKQQLYQIFEYPLTFIAQNISTLRLISCINKTPAKEYTQIQIFPNTLDPRQTFLIIKVSGYYHMEQFLKVKTKIQQHFSRDNVKFIGISKQIIFESIQDRKLLQQLLIKKSHKYKSHMKMLEFDCIEVATSYFFQMKKLGFKVKVSNC